MGDREAQTPVCVESMLGYHSCDTGILTCGRETGRGTMSGGQFDWGGRLLKRNGGVQRLGCSPIKAVRELGSERRETVRSLSVAGAGNLKGAVLSTRGPGWTYHWCTSCLAKGTAG